jgi:hypothetical protein
MVTVIGRNILGKKIFFTVSAFSIITWDDLTMPSEKASQKKKEDRRKYIYGICVWAYGRDLRIDENTNQNRTIWITGMSMVQKIPNPDPAYFDLISFQMKYRRRCTVSSMVKQ